MKFSWLVVSLVIFKADGFLLPRHHKEYINRASFQQGQAEQQQSTSERTENESVVEPHHTERESSTGGGFVSNPYWLEQVTEDILDPALTPLGSLVPDDVDSIVGIMTAWARRQSLEGALKVESLLKRIVDDMKAGNTSIFVTTRHYNIALDAWAKSGVPGAALRAQHIHDAMIELHKETNNPLLAPTSISYNTLISAWSKSYDDDASEHAEKAWADMLHRWRQGDDQLQPNTITFSTLIECYAKRSGTSAVKRAEYLLNMMDELGIPKSVYSYSAVQNCYAKSNLPDAPDKAEAILKEMLQLYKDGNDQLKPNVVNFNGVLNALARTPGIESTRRAEKLLDQMIKPVSEGGYDIEPDRMSYIMTIFAGSRCPDQTFGAQLAERVLKMLEERALADKKRQREVSSVAPPAVYLDVECYNTALQVIAKSDQADSAEKVQAIIDRMQHLVKEGHDVKPNRRTWNSLLHTLAKAPAQDFGDRSEEILAQMWRDHFENERGYWKPDSFTYAAILGGHQRSPSKDSAQRADDVLRQMEGFHEKGHLEYPPDVVHYTIVCAAWAKSRSRVAATRCQQIITHMIERHKAGFENVNPNVRTYNALLDALSRSRRAEKAEELLFHMMQKARDGEDRVAPDAFSFNSVIIAFARSKKSDSGQRAEAILDMMIECHEDGNEQVTPETRSFTHIMGHYARSNAPDAPYKCEYLLNRMIDMYKSGNYPKLAPNNFAFTSVMEAYGHKKHPDAGETAERLLRTMRELKNKYGASNLVVDRDVLSYAILCWTSCGDPESGRKAEVHLETMERQYAEGNPAMKPGARSYGMVLNAWSRSSTEGKGRRALRILRCMQEASRKDKSVTPSRHSYSLVINACGFSNSTPEEEAEAFEIAVTLLDEMMASDNVKPYSLTYGWFFQLCGRLKITPEKKELQMERAFQFCAESGHMNDFVLQRFRGAASESLYKRMLAPVLVKSMPDKLATEAFPRVTAKDLPGEWRRHAQTPRVETMTGSNPRQGGRRKSSVNP